MKSSPYKLVLAVWPLLFLTGCAANTAAPGVTPDSKTWILYWLFMAIFVGGSFLMLVWFPFHSFLLFDWKKRTIKTKHKGGLGPALGYYLVMLHLFVGAIVASNDTNYTYSIEVANDGIHYTSWGQSYVARWSDLHDARVVLGNKGQQRLVVDAKRNGTLKINSMAYWNWDGFLANVQSHMRSAGYLDKFHALDPNSPRIEY